MSRQRSPNYPGRNLQGSLEDAKSIYKREGRSPFSFLTAAQAFGYKSLNGRASMRVSALRQYGLINRQEVGGKKGSQFCLSQRALTLIFQDTKSDKWKKAIKNAALQPGLFQELYGKGKIEASKESIASDLIVDHKFTENGSTICAEVFKDTTAFAQLAAPAVAGLGSDDNDSALEDENLSDGEHEAVQNEKMMGTMPESPPSSSVATRSRVVNLPLSQTEWAKLEASFPISNEAWNQMIVLLETMKPGLTRPTPISPEEEFGKTSPDEEGDR